MSSPHRDLPPGSQRWADEMDALAQKVVYLESLVRRLAQNAGVDPSNPDGRVNAQTDAPATSSPVVQKITSLDDVQAYNVADGQVLTWSQAQQAFTPVTPSSGGDFAPDSSVLGFSAGSQSTTAHGAGALETDSTTGPYAWYGWTDHGHIDIEANDRTTWSQFMMYPTGVYVGAANSDGTNPVSIRLRQDIQQIVMNALSLGIPVCHTATRPTSFNLGYTAVAYDIDVKALIVNDGSGWVQVGGGGTDQFAVPSGTPFSMSGTDPQAEGHNTGASGQYGFMSTSDSEVYLAATDGANGDANVYMSSAGVNIQADAPGTSSDWNMYSEVSVAKDSITLKAIEGNGTGAGGIVKVLANWFIVPVNGHTLVSAAGKQGAMIFDSSLNKPLWSDGTNWRDATGTVVS